MIPFKTPRLRAVVVCAAIALVAATAAGGAFASATAAPACWKSLLNEWYSGSISTIYAPSCYTQALNHLPVDISEYSSARQDIENAYHNALRHLKAPPESHPFNSQSTSTTTTGNTSGNGRKKATGITGIIDDLTPGNPQAFPLPLLVLGALAIVLVIAGGAGMLWQRRHPGGGAGT